MERDTSNSENQQEPTGSRTYCPPPVLFDAARVILARYKKHNPRSPNFSVANNNKTNDAIASTK